MLFRAWLFALRDSTPSAAPATSIARKKTSTRIRLVRILRLASKELLPITAMPFRLFRPCRRMRIRPSLHHRAFLQRHLFAGHQFFDIDENQHAFAQRADAGEILRRERRDELRRRADLRWLQ